MAVRIGHSTSAGEMGKKEMEGMKIPVTPVPLVLWPALSVEVTLHSCDSHATPTSEPVEQFVTRCHNPAPST